MKFLSNRLHSTSTRRRTFLAQFMLMLNAPSVFAASSSQNASKLASPAQPLPNQAALAHVVLLGDSIFDNGSYTNGGPDVIAQVRGQLASGWKATLLAVDGATTKAIEAQLGRLPNDASHLVLSIGGNDALGSQHILRASANSVADAMTMLATIKTRFETNYRHAITACRNHGLPLTICTIYNGNFADRSYQLQVSTALTVFNDVILRVAIEHGLTVLDLRQIFTSSDDYANPIEPSSVGGAKLAKAIIHGITQQRHDNSGGKLPV